MADKLIFPIGFDLEAAVKQAQGDADRLLRKLETTIKSRPLAINLKIDNAGSGSINEINKRMSELVKQWNGLTEAERIHNKTTGEFTPQAKKIIAEYVRLTGATESYARSLQQLTSAARQAANSQEKNLAKQRKIDALLKSSENSIANVTAKLQHYKKEMNAADVGSAQFGKAATEVKRLTERLEQLKTKVKEATGQSTSVNKLTKEFEKQDGYVSRLLKRMAVYASWSAFTNLLRSVREVTAEFELQRVSLGAIIQDQQRANQLFSEIKAFALKSPIKILDLTKYTKQLAAYRFETDKLFDTTKRLADISVGLGVDYGRILLAYGQTKSATYLRAAELRQYTEAGLPLLEQLAEKFSQLEGRMVSTEEVMDKISKRMVTFSMVEEVFKDMTDAGGIFYNMQEKQSQTLYGMWAKLGDAAAIMYSEIGNTAGVNSGMKALITLMQDMMLHWTAFANILQVGVIGIGAYKAAMAGLIPFYKLNRIQVMANIKAEKASQALLLKRTSLYATLTTAQLRQLASTKKLTTAEWEEYITKNKLNQISALRLARMSKENVALQKALINQKLYTASQLQQIQAMSKGQYIWANAKSAVMGLGGAFKSLGAAIKTFWPLALITATLDLFMDWRNAVSAQEDAVKKVDKQYEETKITLMQIENAYRDIQAAAKDAGENEEEFAKTSYSQKLEQLQKIIKLLGQFGMKNVIDPSALDYTNIDPVLDKWLAKLNEANELSRGWGREVALVANAYEGNILGWSVFGENLKEDMKDLERSWTKLSVNSEFNHSLEQLRAIVGKLSNDNKDVYENISRAIGADLKLALGQKRRNESELQYQQRIYKNYQNIESWLRTYLTKGDYKGMLPSLSSEDVGSVLADFQSQVDEVMHEFDKVKEKFRNQDALTVKMAIDTVAAENDWTDWQKELLIQHLNENPITLNAELIPTTNIAGQGAVAEGLKAIITSEFPTLFNENELQSLVSAEGIVEAIKGKLDASNESLEKTMQLQNNLAYGSKGFENSLERVKKLQQEISDAENMRAELQQLEAIEGEKSDEQILRQSELQAKLADVDEASLNTKRAQIAAIVEANAKYDEQIKKQRESAEAEREIAKAALDRVTSMGLSDLGKDVKEQFAGLRVDAVKAITDNNYSTDFLISDEDLKKIRDVGDLYDIWAKNTKAIKDEKEKLVGVGIIEATIEKERAALEAKRATIQLQLKEVETAISDEKFKGQEAQYASLKLALANATTAAAQQKAQDDLNKFLGDTKNAEFAILMMKKEGLKTTLQETLVSQAANTQIADYLKGLDDAEKLWEELGKRYNFKLQGTGRNGRGSSGEDPWILLMKNRMKFMQDFQKGVENLSKWMGNTKALADEQENMLGRGLSLKIDSRELDGSKEELIKWYEDSIGEIRKRIAKLGGKEWEGLGVQMILAKDTKSRVLKKYQELLADMFKELTDFRTEQAQKAIESKIKQLADRISRTKTAREFYDKVLGMTGDYELAGKVALSIYGSNGDDLKQQLAKQIRELTNDLELPDGIISADNIVDYKALREWAELNKDELGKTYDELVKIAEQGQKDLAKTYEGYLKDLEKAKSYSDKRIELARYTANKIAEIEASKYPKDVKDSMIADYNEREDKEAAKLEYEAFKDLPIYTQMFDDLEHASTSTLTNMRDKLMQMQEQWKDLDPTQLKELQSRLNEVETQLASRNPFKTLSDSIKEYKELQRAHGSESKLNKEINAAIEANKQVKKELEDQLASNPDDKEAVENLQKRVDLSEEELKQLQKIAAAYKRVKDLIGLSLGEVFQIAHSLGDLASGIGKITEVFGGSEEDVQYWNDIANGLNEVTSGIENVVQAALSGNPVGIVSSVITAVPNMISGFSNLFSAGKVRKANKEIKRQQELLDQLEYSYSRLEKAADKLFGADYINNYNQQIKNLEAQAAAYKKQAEAERSKGKKADEEKIKEFENAYRDTMDEIADMEAELTAKFVGASRTDLARDFVQSWLEAKASFASTTDAIKSKYKDMIQSMIVEGAAAKVLDNILAPMWDDMNKLLTKGDIAGAIDYLVNGMDAFVQQADDGLNVLWKSLAAKGYDMKKLLGETSGSEYTGIKRDIAGASEETMSNVATIGNTLMYYVSPIPGIAENVAAMRALMDGGSMVSMPTTSAGWTDWQQQAMDAYTAIQRNTADAVVECRRIAIACEEEVAQLRRVIVPRGTKGSHGVQVYM